MAYCLSVRLYVTLKVTINGLYNVVHVLSIAAKVYDLEWPLSEIKGHWLCKWRKNDEMQLSNDSDARVAGGIISIRPTYSCTCALTYLLTYK